MQHYGGSISSHSTVDKIRRKTEMSPSKTEMVEKNTPENNEVGYQLQADIFIIMRTTGTTLNALKRHESFNGLLKQNKILDTRFRHNKEIFASAFEACCVLAQYRIEREIPLFDIL